MSYGLVDIQRDLDSSANQGLEHAAAMEGQRKQAWQEIKQADDASRKNAIAMGTGAGFMVGGPVGAVAGAGIGYLAYKFL